MTFTFKTFRKRKELPEAALAVFLERTCCSLKVYLSFSPCWKVLCCLRLTVTLTHLSLPDIILGFSKYRCTFYSSYLINYAGTV